MTRQLLQHDPRLGYRFVPGLRARVAHEGGGYLMASNALGFRSREVTTPDPGVRRVLLFGDSFTAGDGVSDGRRFGDLLETLVPDLVVQNFGLPGTGTDQQYLSYLEHAAAVPHDLVVVAVLVENVRRVAAPYRCFVEGGRVVAYAKPWFDLDEDQLVLRGIPVPRRPLGDTELRCLVEASDLAAVTAGFGDRTPVPEYDDATNRAWRTLRAILRDWAAAEHPSPLLVVPLPLFSHVEETAAATAYRRRFAELAATSGFALHDPLPDLLRYPAPVRRGFRFARDVHPTVAGHRALAESLAPAVSCVLARGAA